MKILVKPSSLKGDIVPPKSKSILHRYLICKYLSNSLIDMDGLCEDNKYTLNALKSLTSEKQIEVGNSASTLRFLIPICLALNINAKFVLGDSLSKRPFDFINDTFTNQGVQIIKDNNEVKLFGNIKPSTFYVDASISSQLISGLLFALPLLNGDSRVLTKGRVSSSPYISMTIEVLKKFGINIDCIDGGFFIKGNQKYIDTTIDIDSDFSSLAYYYVLKKFGFDINIKNETNNIVQGDYWIKDMLDRKEIKFNMINNIDLCPILSLYLANQNQVSYLYNVDNLFYKESNRVNGIIDLLKAFSIKAEYKEIENGTIIVYGDKLKSMSKYISDDHRLLMSAVVGSLLVGGTIEGIENINKSYPNFIDDMIAIGGAICLID